MHPGRPVRSNAFQVIIIFFKSVKYLDEEKTLYIRFAMYIKTHIGSVQMLLSVHSYQHTNCVYVHVILLGLLHTIVLCHIQTHKVARYRRAIPPNSSHSYGTAPIPQYWEVAYVQSQNARYSRLLTVT